MWNGKIKVNTQLSHTSEWKVARKTHDFGPETYLFHAWKCGSEKCVNAKATPLPGLSSVSVLSQLNLCERRSSRKMPLKGKKDERIRRRLEKQTVGRRICERLLGRSASLPRPWHGSNQVERLSPLDNRPALVWTAAKPSRHPKRRGNWISATETDFPAPFRWLSSKEDCCRCMSVLWVWTGT